MLLYLRRGTRFKVYIKRDAFNKMRLIFVFVFPFFPPHTSNTHIHVHRNIHHVLLVHFANVPHSGPLLHHPSLVPHAFSFFFFNLQKIPLITNLFFETVLLIFFSLSLHQFQHYLKDCLNLRLLTLSP